MKLIREARLALAVVAVLGLLIYALPWALYAWGLSLVDGRPTPPETASISDGDRLFLQEHLRSSRPLQVRPLSPWSYIAMLVAADKEASRDKSTVTCWIVARDYNEEHLRGRRAPWQVLSGVAMTIWVSRHWTSDEVLAAVMQRTNDGDWRGKDEERRRARASLPQPAPASGPAARESPQ
ncbi:MAG: hypothetical protein ACREVL_02015 [Solimonas sp.]